MGTSGVFSSASSSRSGVRVLLNNPRAERQILLNGAAAQCSSSSSSSLTGAMGVSVAPWSGAPGGSVTSALQVGHCPSAPTPDQGRRGKLTSFLHFINHSSHSSLWNTCPQGKILTTSPRWNESMHIAHSSLE